MFPKSVNSYRPAYLKAADDLKKNDGQWLAYNSDGNCVILAGPGSGKTKTLTIKVAKILEEEIRLPRRIACITYNNQCARELRKRLSNLGIEDGSRASICTLHSFCLKHIIIPYLHLTDLPKKYPIQIATASQTKHFQQKAVDRINSGHRSWGLQLDRYRRRFLDRTKREWRETDSDAAKVIELYESFLDEEGLIDFDGMVLIGLFLIENYPWVKKSIAAQFPVLVVDEYQDLGHALDRIVQILCFDAKIRLIAVGDPDQSIYGFTGAQPSLLKNLSQRKDVNSISLKLNYRCGDEIIQASQIVLKENKGFKSGHEARGRVYFHYFEDGFESQCENILKTIIPESMARRNNENLGDIAILYQDKNDGDVIADAVNKIGWQYIRSGGNNLYQQSPVTYWLEDCAAWCAGGWKLGDPKLSSLVQKFVYFNDSVREESQRRKLKACLVKFLYANRNGEMLLNNWLKGIMESCLRETLEREFQLWDDRMKVENLTALTEDGKVLSPYTVAFFGGLGGSPNHLNLTTRHSSKGLEYDVVIMTGLEEGRIPSYNANEEDKLEQRRIFYVGITRARYEVHLVYSGWYKNQYGTKYKKGRSTFVDEVEAEIIKPIKAKSKQTT